MGVAAVGVAGGSVAKDGRGVIARAVRGEWFAVDGEWLAVDGADGGAMTPSPGTHPPVLSEKADEGFKGSRSSLELLVGGSSTSPNAEQKGHQRPAHAIGVAPSHSVGGDRRGMTTEANRYLLIRMGETLSTQKNRTAICWLLLSSNFGRRTGQGSFGLVHWPRCFGTVMFTQRVERALCYTLGHHVAAHAEWFWR